MSRRAASHDVEVRKRLRAQRRARRMTQRALAEALGITVQQLQQYQKGRHRISARGLLKIASILGMPVTALHGADGKAGRTRRADLGVLESAGAMRLMRAYATLPRRA